MRFLFDPTTGANIGYRYRADPSRGPRANRHIASGSMLVAFVESAYSSSVVGSFKFPDLGTCTQFPHGSLADKIPMPAPGTMPTFALVPVAQLGSAEIAGLQWIAGLQRRDASIEHCRAIDECEKSGWKFALALVALRDLQPGEDFTVLPLTKPTPAQVTECPMRLPWFARRLLPSVASIAVQESIPIRVESACAVMLRQRFKLPRIDNEAMTKLMWNRVSVVADVLLAFGVVRQSPRLWEWVRPGTVFPEAWQRPELFTNYQRLLQPVPGAAGGGGEGKGPVAVAAGGGSASAGARRPPTTQAQAAAAAAAAAAVAAMAAHAVPISPQAAMET